MLVKFDVVFVVVDETVGFEMLNIQNVGLVIGADSGPEMIYYLVSIINIQSLTTGYSSTCNT